MVTKDALREALAGVLGNVSREAFEAAVSAAFRAADNRPAPPAGWRYLDSDECEAELFSGADPESALVRYAGDWCLVVGKDEGGGYWRAELFNPAAERFTHWGLGTEKRAAALTLAKLAADHASSVGIGEGALEARFRRIGFEPF